MNTYEKFVRILREKWQIEELPESPLLRSNDGYFTFSPFQDTEENFASLKNTSSIFVKYQPTIRKLNALDLTNPLNLNYQTTYAVQKYQRSDQIDLIKQIIEVSREKLFPQIVASEVEITYPDILHDYFAQQKFDFKLNEVATTDRYLCKLDIPGKHYYIKVRMKFKTGSINVVDFVLVDYDSSDFSSQLDSIWVENLIDLLTENKRFIFDESKYQAEKAAVAKYTNEPRDQHVIINDVRTVLKVMSLGVLPAAKGINSEVKRKIRHLYFYYVYYVNNDIDELVSVVEQIGKVEKYSADILAFFTENLRATQKNYRAAIKTVKKKNLTREVAQSSLGLPDEYYGDFLHNWHSEYDF